MNRPLSALEHVLWLIDQKASQNFVMVARVSGPIKKHVLRQALDIVQDKHPPLKCKFKDSEPPEFVSASVPQIPLRIIPRKNNDHWVEVAEKEMREYMPWTTGPLFRVVLLNSQSQCDLIIACCHIVTDAAAGVTFVKDLLSIAGKLSKGEKVEPDPPLPELPSSLDLLKKDLEYPPDPLDSPGEQIKDAPKPVDIIPEKKAPPEKMCTRVMQRILPEDDAKTLIKRCRKEKTSVHGALCAALLQSAVKHIRDSQDVPGEGPLTIGCITPVNIRHLFSRHLGDEMGDFISDAIHYQAIDNNSSFWDAAREVKESIKTELKYGRDIKAIRGIGDLLKNRKDLLKIVEESLPPVVVTNMGRLDIDAEYGDIKLKELHFTASVNPVAKIGIAVTSFTGAITLNFLYLDPCLSKTNAEIMINSTMKRLKDAIA